MIAVEIVSMVLAGAISVACVCRLVKMDAKKSLHRWAVMHLAYIAAAWLLAIYSAKLFQITDGLPLIPLGALMLNLWITRNTWGGGQAEISKKCEGVKV